MRCDIPHHMRPVMSEAKTSSNKINLKISQIKKADFLSAFLKNKTNFSRKRLRLELGKYYGTTISRKHHFAVFDELWHCSI